MVLLTMIARQQDGLPLAASVQEDEQVRFMFSSSASRGCEANPACSGRNCPRWKKETNLVLQDAEACQPCCYISAVAAAASFDR